MNDDGYLLKLKRQGKTDEFIAVKMGITVPDVQRRWEALLQMASQPQQNGSMGMRQLTVVMTDQFKLMGQTLGLLVQSSLNTMNPSELRAVIESCPQDADLAGWILTRAIVLHPFSLPSPEELAKDAEAPQTPGQN